MKRSPQEERLEQMLRSSKLVAGGFMGNDPRHPKEVIEADLGHLEKLGYTPQQVAQKMRELTHQARPFLGNWTEVEGRWQVRAEDYKGMLICPWPHAGRFEKEITTCRRMDTGQEIQWSNLNIHLIEKHGFFEGRGSHFRLEPDELVKILFEI